jgi:CheY-specific phosphatase CheX
MISNLETPLYKAAASTFEDLAMMFPSRELDELQQVAPTETGVCVRFAGPFAGRLEVHLTTALLPTLAANMLGDDEATDESVARDALGELANVICGNVLPAIAGSKEVFHLSAPAHLVPGAVDPSGLPLAARAQLGLDEGRAEIRLFVAGEPG